MQRTQPGWGTALRTPRNPVPSAGLLDIKQRFVKQWYTVTVIDSNSRPSWTDSLTNNELSDPVKSDCKPIQHTAAWLVLQFPHRLASQATEAHGYPVAIWSEILFALQKSKSTRSALVGINKETNQLVVLKNSKLSVAFSILPWSRRQQKETCHCCWPVTAIQFPN